MTLRPLLPFALAGLVALLPALADAHPDVRGVGLGFAGGVAYSPSMVKKGDIEFDVGTSFAWGFFVDIPLLETFFISPAAMLYEFNLGKGREAATDIDLNFKFIVPLDRLRLGAGITAGLTATRQYDLHVGALGYLSYNLASNVDLFLLAQYKRLFHEGANVDQVHGYLGGMFRF